MSQRTRLRAILLSLGFVFLGYCGDAFCQSTLAVTASPAAASESAPAKDAGGAIVTPTPAAPTGNFFQRLAKAYSDDWKELPSSDATPAFRSTPSPVEGPPFPFSDWPYGGSVVVTKPWTQSGPLMQALWSGPHGEGW